MALMIEKLAPPSKRSMTKFTQHCTGNCGQFWPKTWFWSRSSFIHWRLVSRHWPLAPFQLPKTTMAYALVNTKLSALRDIGN
ncbi:elsinochrome C biosynthesis cluster protein [Parastagonospora nodorum]|uniref:Elsinochrome C biosynthesis cluster protein SNOG_08613 n=2 Tax=Phaeosphaeria nodorum (strain SN15 / ATCC MYA-4574 / FGSC 10173) TaxID=321614 RepID=ELCX_PHANO|nr:hypothetical protein SNOG_08613 [Parastagonospora nodorum SN15]Q0UI01.1 RecName: Full=Elsinochrome C biosynthesis cluster protein SNOG_08613 [Parastagonospora nodorum SN15]KAH3906781.1 elsinochrome C biosynthesis cluster protein [Parastagonospora nodorum]EAT83781.1 hypothetical protein SNOG_08613 [Parastagonospora nodorum SN15]KAH3924646.1 elsinochrome C biosynthesis cluster protein [Parastagonospora nodorum]KAH3941929.1 elsinochrome C biosynthesis cluster protein [Parastagonospora nodorum]